MGYYISTNYQLNIWNSYYIVCKRGKIIVEEQFIIFNLGKESYAAQISQVKEIIYYTELTRILELLKVLRLISKMVKR